MVKNNFFVNLVNIDQLERWEFGKRPGGPKWLLGTSYTNDMTIFTSALYIFYAKPLPVCKGMSVSGDYQFSYS